MSANLFKVIALWLKTEHLMRDPLLDHHKLPRMLELIYCLATEKRRDVPTFQGSSQKKCQMTNQL